MSLDRIIFQLGVIASVPEHGRLRRDYYGGISVEDPSSFQALFRSYNRDSRRRTTEDIEMVIDAAFEKADDLMNSIYVSSEYELKPNEEKDRQKVLGNLSRIENGLSESQSGIENLKQTYANDKNTSIQLALFADKITEKITEISTFRESRKR